MPLIKVSLAAPLHAAVLAQLGPRATAARYVADVLRLHLVALQRAREAERQRVVLDYLPLARALARRVWRAHLAQCLPGTESGGGAGVIDLEEVVAEVTAALCLRAQHWDPDRGITLGAYAEAWLLAAARRAIKRTWAGELPELEAQDTPERAAVQQEVRQVLRRLPRRLRRAAAALAGEAGGVVDDVDRQRIAAALGAGPSVRLAALKEAAQRLGVAVRTLQAQVQQGRIPAVRQDGGWYVPETELTERQRRSTSVPCQVSCPPWSPASEVDPALPRR